MKLAIGAILASMSGHGDIQSLTPVDRDIAGIVHQVKGVMDDATVVSKKRGKVKPLMLQEQSQPTIHVLPVKPVDIRGVIQKNQGSEGFEKYHHALSYEGNIILDIKFRGVNGNSTFFDVRVFFAPGDMQQSYQLPIMVESVDDTKLAQAVSEIFLICVEAKKKDFDMQFMHTLFTQARFFKRPMPGESNL